MLTGVGFGVSIVSFLQAKNSKNVKAKIKLFFIGLFF
jgi:hypothetical protein